MKILNLAALVAVTAVAALGSAQGRPGRPPMGGPGMGDPGGMRGSRSPQQQVDMVVGLMAQTAGLSPAQQAKVKPIMLKYALTVRRLQDERMAALKKLLTPDQMAKVATMRGMGRGQGGPGGGRPGMGGPGGMRRGG